MVADVVRWLLVRYFMLVAFGDMIRTPDDAVVVVLLLLVVVILLLFTAMLVALAECVDIALDLINISLWFVAFDDALDRIDDNFIPAAMQKIQKIDWYQLNIELNWFVAKK